MGAGTRRDALMRGKAACLQPRCPRAPAHPTPSRGSREVGAFSHTLQTTLDPAVPLVLPSTFHAPSLWDRQWSQEEMPLVSKIARNGAQGWSSLGGADRGGPKQAWSRERGASGQERQAVQAAGGACAKAWGQKGGWTLRGGHRGRERIEQESQLGGRLGSDPGALAALGLRVSTCSE